MPIKWSLLQRKSKDLYFGLISALSAFSFNQFRAFFTDLGVHLHSSSVPPCSLPTSAGHYDNSTLLAGLPQP